jgi:hypothetical protein
MNLTLSHNNNPIKNKIQIPPKISTQIINLSLCKNNNFKKTPLMKNPFFNHNILTLIIQENIPMTLNF